MTEEPRCPRCGHPSWSHCLRTVKVPFSKEHADSICAECIRLGWWPNCPAFVPPPPKAEKKEG